MNTCGRGKRRYRAASQVIMGLCLAALHWGAWAGEDDHHTDDSHGGAAGHHHHDSWVTPPQEYRNRTSDRWGSAEAVKRGDLLYQANCTACHGADGQGTGPLAASLPHAPADLTHHFHRGPGGGDDYLFWRVSEGGAVDPFRAMGSAMPAFKSVLTEAERWDVLAYVHKAFHKGYRAETADALEPEHGMDHVHEPQHGSNAQHAHGAHAEHEGHVHGAGAGDTHTGHGSHHSHHAGVSWTWGDWNMMFHGVLKGIYNNQGGPRGDELTYLSGDFGLMGERQVGPGILELTAMLTPDPLMGPSGYPSLLQTGETADGRTPLVDRQHPHDFVMEVSAGYTLPLSQETRLRAYLGWPGEPALGPPAPDHRFSGAEIPETPITHHWMDSTHVSFGVATLGLSWRNWKVEGSVFNGREPDQRRWNIETGDFDSTSFRVSYSPTENWTLQVSHGFLKSPRQLFPGINTDRTTTSIIHHVRSGDSEWGTTFAWGRNWDIPGPNLDGFLLESTYKYRDTHTFFARAERVTKNDLFFGNDPLAGREFTVNKLSIGYIYDFAKTGHIRWGIGVLGNIAILPEELEKIYTANPVGMMTFIRGKMD